MDNQTMNHGSLFSGIGGFDLAAQWMGWDNIFHMDNRSERFGNNENVADTFGIEFQGGKFNAGTGNKQQQLWIEPTLN